MAYDGKSVAISYLGHLHLFQCPKIFVLMMYILKCNCQCLVCLLHCLKFQNKINMNETNEVDTSTPTINPTSKLHQKDHHANFSSCYASNSIIIGIIILLVLILILLIIMVLLELRRRKQIMITMV